MAMEFLQLVGSLSTRGKSGSAPSSQGDATRRNVVWFHRTRPVARNDVWNNSVNCSKIGQQVLVDNNQQCLSCGSRQQWQNHPRAEEIDEIQVQGFCEPQRHVLWDDCRHFWTNISGENDNDDNGGKNNYYIER